MRGELILVLALGGCRELPELTADVCGNGVVEIGEDCDGSAACSPADAVAPCRLTCSDTACPAGWGCGSDAVCRHGTGELVVGRSFALPHEDLTIADVDGDAIGDVIGFDQRGARVAFGEQTVIAVSPDQVTGPGAVGDLDGDGRADIVTPFALGLAIGRGESDRSVTPLAYAPFAAGFDSWFVPMRVPGSAPGHALAALSPGMFGTFVQVFGVPSGTQHPPVALAPNVTPAQLGPQANRADLDAPSAEDELVVAASGRPEVWRLHPNVSGGLIQVVTEVIATPASHVSDGRATLADLDGDGDLDLIAGTIAANQLGVAIAINTNGVFGPLVTDDVRFAPLGESAALPDVPSAPQQFPLALADLDGDGDVDAISPDAVFEEIGGVLRPTYRRSTAAPWREAVIADLDRDGRPDVVVASHLPGLDVLRSGDGGFTRVAIDTAGPTANLRTGDFDGDGLTDIAFRERTTRGDRLRVLFGTVGAFEPPLPVMGGPAILRFEVGRFGDARGVFELADDLAITVRDNNRGRLAFVEGAGDRRLRSALFLVRGPEPDVPLGAITGRFGSSASASVVALSRTTDGTRRLWIFPPTRDAAYEPDTAIVTAELGELATLEIRRLAAADLDGDGLDEVIALGARPGDGSALVVVISPRADLARTVIEPDVGEPVDLAVGDIDGDGSAELVIAGSTGLARWRAGVLDHAFVSAESVCLAQLDADPELELALVILNSLAVVDGDDLAATPRFFPLPAVGRVVRAGDLDGDRVDDLVVGDGSVLTQFLSIPQVAR